ncbi:MAG: carbon-nitrogen hydrolase family protein [Thermoplasmatota archaeon]
MKLALFSAAARLGDVEANVAAAAASVQEAGADVAVFPELHLTGYNIGDDVTRLAFAGEDERLEPLRSAAAAARCAVVAGAPRTPRPGITHNSAALIDADGSLSWYDKRCLATFTTFREGLFFQPGGSSPVWETAHGRIGLSICYDLYFPEFQRQQALDGADLLLNISASPATTRRFFQAILPARAIENASFAAQCNVVGAQDGVVFWGGSHAIGPRGDLLAAAEPFQDTLTLVDIDWDDLGPAREFRPTLRDAAAAEAAAQWAA